MTKPIISTFNTIAPLIVQQYERYLPTAFDESLTLLQKMNLIINKLGEIGEVTNSVVEQWNTVMEWVMGEGLTDAVTAKLDELLADGSLAFLVNYTAHYIKASSFTGATGGEKIQNALNFVVDAPHKIVVVDFDGTPDSGGVWLTTGLKIPSNTTLLLNGCTIKLANGSNTSIISNSDFVNGNQNIYIVGTGKVIFDCNGANQTATDGNDQLGLHFYNIDGFTFKGFTIKDPIHQHLVPERATNGFIDEITFDCQGNISQDGVHIIGPSSNIIVTKLRGVLGDDACVVNARINPPQAYGGGGDIENIIFDDVIIRGGLNDSQNSYVGLLRTAPENKINNVKISNAIGRNLKQALLKLGGDVVSTIDKHTNVSAQNVTGYQGGSGAISLVYMNTPVKNLKIDNANIESQNVQLFANRGKDIDGLQLTNVNRTLLTLMGETTQTYSFEFINGSIKNVQMSNIKDNHPSGVSSTYLLGFTNASNVENIQVDKVSAVNVSRYIDTTGATLKNVRLRDVILNTNDVSAFTGITSDKDLLINGFAVETGDGVSATPLRTKYHIGDRVYYRKGSSDTVWKVFEKDHTDKWVRVDRNVVTNRLTLSVGDVGANSTVVVNIPYAESTNEYWYQLKPSFQLPSGILYSYQNFTAGQIRLTVFNATGSLINIPETAWLITGIRQTDILG